MIAYSHRTPAPPASRTDIIRPPADRPQRFACHSVAPPDTVLTEQRPATLPLVQRALQVREPSKRALRALEPVEAAALALAHPMG